jgi:hypothetical protein
MECWGAQGGNANSYNAGNGPIVYGGKGAYVCGTINLTSEAMFYIFVGGKGNDGGKIGILIPTGGWNGGGNGSMGYNDTEQTGGAGGGSTDIRLEKGNWNNFNSLKSRILVASAGAGTQSYVTHGIIPSGGGINGYGGTASKESNNIRFATGGSQNSGGISSGGIISQSGPTGSSGYGTNGGFGYGGASNVRHGGGGGSGFYGGGGGGWVDFLVASGGSGSSFISGHTGCNAISSSSTSSNIVHTGQPNHYSGYVFTNTVMKAGDESMPSPTGGTETGHSGNGYAKITWMPVL